MNETHDCWISIYNMKNNARKARKLIGRLYISLEHASSLLPFLLCG